MMRMFVQCLVFLQLLVIPLASILASGSSSMASITRGANISKPGCRSKYGNLTVGALANLHSSASMPIIRRDVKSVNILLYEYYTAKIFDFGASRLVPLDQTQVTTLVQGTLGYLDPEYFLSSQLNEKSDVYSFSVVLVELVIGRKPLSTAKAEEEGNLAIYFIVKENRLLQILDPRILREGTLEQVHEVAELVKRCLKLVRDERPTMKVVAMELERLRKLGKLPWVQHEDRGEQEYLDLVNSDQ